MVFKEIKDLIYKDIEESFNLKKLAIENLINPIFSASELIINSLKSKGKVLICGNGGSAADAQHMAAELVGRFKKDRSPLPAIALNVNTSIITAISNDFNFDTIFERQVKALMTRNDTLVGITTSGKSKNIINALIAAKELKGKTICLVGRNIEEIESYTDVIISVPSMSTPRIQEVHILICHILCNIIDTSFK